MPLKLSVRTDTQTYRFIYYCVRAIAHLYGGLDKRQRSLTRSRTNDYDHRVRTAAAYYTLHSSGVPTTTTLNN